MKNVAIIQNETTESCSSEILTDCKFYNLPTEIQMVDVGLF